MEPEEVFHKTIPVIRDFNLNPHCPHGPTILFDRNGSRFFSCSAYRSRKLCSFFLPEDNWKPQPKKVQVQKSELQSEEFQGSVNPKTKKRTGNNQDTVLDVPDKRHRSLNLDDDSDPRRDPPQVQSTSKKCRKNITVSTLHLPEATQVDKGEAQYHFTEDTVKFFVEQFRSAGINSIICIGTPSLHAYIRINSEQLGMKSFLLDIDERLINKHPRTECALYNMCNHHFFNDRQHYDLFLKTSSSLAIVTDPPFGVKVELIWNGALKHCRDDFLQYHTESLTSHFEIFWIFPYFMEGHILSKCSNSGLKMSDYKVLYNNHNKFSDKKKTTGKSSPVRIFTTMPLTDLQLPTDFYHYCALCKKWVDLNNVHCDICGTCPTKDGGNSYVHCTKCQKCVKPSWIHCQSPCGKCHLKTADCRPGSSLRTQTEKKFPNPFTKKLKFHPIEYSKSHRKRSKQAKKLIK